MSDPVTYSIIIPVYNEEDVVTETYHRLKLVLERVDEPYEMIFVDDGSHDRTALLLKRLAVEDPGLRLIEFSRNFGHQLAITAGMDFASGRALVVIDGDLQDPPEVIPRLIAGWKAGYDVVYAQRGERQGENWFKKFSARCFYRLLRRMTDVAIPVDTGDFRLIDARVNRELQTIRERNRYIRGLISWLGFRQIGIVYIRDERHQGKTKFSLGKMIHFALDAITSFSDKPLRIASYMGFFLSGASFVYLMVVLYQKIFTNSTVPGWASILAVNLFFNGIILMILGIIGEYISRIYDEAKGRPLYVIRGLTNLPNRQDIKKDGGDYR